MDRKQYLFNYFLFLHFAVIQVMSFRCNEKNLLTPNLTVNENNILLVKNESYIDINANQSLYLTCAGIEPFEWILPKDHLHFKDNTTFADSKYISQLSIERIDTEYVGFYSCHFIKALHKDNEVTHSMRNRFNSIYVFVTDMTQLFVSKLLRSAIPAVNNSEVNISCQPSSSFARMTLWEVNEHNSSLSKELSISPENGITYDPKYGFHLNSLKAEKLQCIAQLNDSIEELNINIHFSSGIEYEPSLDDSNSSFVFVGDNFSLICKIQMTVSSQIQLEWNWDQVCTQDWKNRLTIADPVPNTHETLLKSSYISVTNAQLSDEGIYKCLAYDWSYSHKEVTKFVQIYDSAALKLETDNDTKVLTCNQEFIFKVSIIALPNEEKALNLVWMKDRDGILENSDRIIISRNKSEFAELRIDNLVFSDSGIYTLSAKLSANSYTLHSNVSLNLRVIGCRSEKPKQGLDNIDQIVLITVFTIFGGVLLMMAIFLGKKIKERKSNAFHLKKQKRELELLSRNFFENGQMDLINPDLPIDEQIDLLPYDEKWEFSRENLKLGQILGQGAFGRVIKADAYGIEDTSPISTVAVKMLKERADVSQRKTLLAELKILIHVGRHMNIVNLLGAVTKDLTKGELMVIVEYCRLGNIRSFLLAHRRTFINQLNKEIDEIDSTITEREERNGKYVNYSFTADNNQVEYQNISFMEEKPLIRGRFVTSCDLVSYVFQCAKGMEYLSSKKLIHRDLAARNVLLADDGIIKICDFGLARDCYKYDYYIKKGEEPLPIKWMAIESIRDKVYTTKSDVWSFGVFMWEVFTLGANPYPGFEIDEEFFKKLLDGYRMEKPELSPNNIYSIMNNCWKHEPSHRPDFTFISSQLKNLMQINAIKRYENQMERYKNNTVGNSSIQYITINSKTETIQNYDTNNNKRNNSVRVIVENHLKDNNNNVQNVGSILN